MQMAEATKARDEVGGRPTLQVQNGLDDLPMPAWAMHSNAAQLASRVRNRKEKERRLAKQIQTAASNQSRMDASNMTPKETIANTHSMVK
jgi:hypothetical protein